MTREYRIRLFCAAAAGLLLLTGCAQPVPESPAEEILPEEVLPATAADALPLDPVSREEFFARYEQPGAGYQAPAALYAEFHADKAKGNNSVLLDLSMVNQGGGQ